MARTTQKRLTASAAAFAVAIAAVFVATASARPHGSAGPNATQAQTPTKVNVTYMNILALAPLFAGEEAGIFRRWGIKNEYQNVNLYLALPIIAQGKVDVGIMASSAAFYNAINGGQQVVAFADRLTYSCRSDNKLVVRKELWDQGVQTYPQLAGKTLAILGKGSATEYWNHLLEKRFKMKDSSFASIKYLSYPDTVTALKTGGVDAGYLAEPLLSQAVADGIAVPIVPMYNVVPRDNVGFMIFSRNFAKKIGTSTKIGPSQRWANAWLASVRYYLDPKNRAKVLSAVSKWTDIPVSSLSRIYGTDSWAWMNPNGAVDLLGPNRAMQWMLDNDYLESIPQTNQWYDRGFSARAVKTLGKAKAKDPCWK